MSYFGINPRVGNPAIKRPIMAASRNKVEPMRDQCSSKGLGYFGCTARRAHSSSGSETSAQTCRCCGDRAQAGGRRLAYADQGRGLHLEPSGAPAVETSETRAQSRSSVSPRRPSERIGRRLQQQVSARQRARGDRQCRGRIPPVCCELETAIAKGALGARMRCDDHRLRDRAGTSTLLFATGSPSGNSRT